MPCIGGEPVKRRSRKLDILGIVYEVIFTNEDLCDELEDRYGYTDLDKKIIVIRDSDSPDVQQDTLIHEVGHALIAESGLLAFFELTLPAKTDRSAWEESLISAVAPRVVQLIKRNKRKLWLLK